MYINNQVCSVTPQCGDVAFVVNQRANLDYAITKVLHTATVNDFVSMTCIEYTIAS